MQMQLGFVQYLLQVRYYTKLFNGNYFNANKNMRTCIFKQ